MKKLFVVMIVVLMIAAFTGVAGAVPAPTEPSSVLVGQELDFVTLYETVSPSVVYIEVISRGGGDYLW